MYRRASWSPDARVARRNPQRGVRVNKPPSELGDHELVSRIQRKEDDIEAAKRAFEVFFQRHVRYVYQSVRYANEQLVGFGVDAEDIVQEAFAKVWLTACHSYEPAKANAGMPSTASTRAWLGTIVSNLIRDRLRSPVRAVPVDPGPDNEDLFVTVDSEDKVEAAIALEQLVASTLSERDAEIVWFKINAYDPLTRKSEPDREALASFCQRWGIKPDTLRQVYLRALRTLEIALATIPQ